MNRTGNIRFRSGFMGVLILQIEYFPLDGQPSGMWRDATIEDLSEIGLIASASIFETKSALGWRVKNEI